MKVTITHLKAPWPAGAKPGDVCELPHSEVPGWALGKCVPAEADAEATLVFNIEPAAEPAKADKKAAKAG